MDFQTKNFAYTTKLFGDFLDQIDRGEKLYLRSLSAEKPAELPADIARDFRSIASDFRLPPELAMVRENAHSCPLRISGPVVMWLHYDASSSLVLTASAYVQ
jgi:tRNA wybutosine-synthesizing protein 4